MRRRSCVLSVVLVSILGCGEDNNAASESMERADAAVAGGETQTPQSAVDNPGAACSGERGCQGPSARCLADLKVISGDVAFPGGYCSASCESSADCGPQAACPVVEIRAQLQGSPLASAFANLPAKCLKRCSDDGSCRQAEGYRCARVIDVLPAALSAVAGGVLGGTMAGSQTYCVPPSTM